MSAQAATRIPIEFNKGFGGINTLHTRYPGQPSAGKNFWTKNAKLSTREDTALLAGTSFSGSIRSMHAVQKVGLPNSVMLVEEGANLHHSRDGLATWSVLKADVSGNKYNSCIWGTPFGDYYLLLASGSQMLVYDIQDGTISNLINNDGDVPNIEFWTMYKGFVFAWAPNYADSNLIRFCGYDDDERVSIDYWPLDFAINPSGNPGEPVMAAHSFGDELFVLTDKASYWLIGNNEENFEPRPASNIGLYKTRCSALVGDYIIWLNQERKVNVCSGTESDSISQRIDSLLARENLTNVFAESVGSRFYLHCPNTDHTTSYVFDIVEKEWYIHEIPGVISAGAYYGEYMSVPVPYFGLNDGRIIKMDGTTGTDFDGNRIETDMTFGPINLQGRKLKGKYFHLTANPLSSFSLDVYSSVDQKEERGPKTMEFEAGAQYDREVKINSKKGQNLSVRVNTTDRINELIAGEITLQPGRLK